MIKICVFLCLMLLIRIDALAVQPNPADSLEFNNNKVLNATQSKLSLTPTTNSSTPNENLKKVDLHNLVTTINQLERAGDIDEAIRLSSTLLTEIPDSLEAFNNLARLHTLNGNLETAIDILEQGIATNSTLNTMHQNLRKLFIEVARQAYAKALNEADGNSTTLAKPPINLSLSALPIHLPEMITDEIIVNREDDAINTPLLDANSSYSEIEPSIAPEIHSKEKPKETQIIFSDDAYDLPSAYNHITPAINPASLISLTPTQISYRNS